MLLCELAGRLVAMGHVLMCEIKKKLSRGVWSNVSEIKLFKKKSNQPSPNCRPTTTFTHLAVEPTPFYPSVCLHHAFAVHNLI